MTDNLCKRNAVCVRACTKGTQTEVMRVGEGDWGVWREEKQQNVGQQPLRRVKINYNPGAILLSRKTIYHFEMERTQNEKRITERQAIFASIKRFHSYKRLVAIPWKHPGSVCSTLLDGVENKCTRNRYTSSARLSLVCLLGLAFLEAINRLLLQQITAKI